MSSRLQEQTKKQTVQKLYFRIMEIFKIRTTNEENNDFIITIGNHLATERHFASEKEAEEYLKEKPWDMIVALIAEIIIINKQKEQISLKPFYERLSQCPPLKVKRLPQDTILHYSNPTGTHLTFCDVLCNKGKQSKNGY